MKHLQSQGLSIQAACIFGSQAGDETDQWSDIDLCVVSKNLLKNPDLVTGWMPTYANPTLSSMNSKGRV